MFILETGTLVIHKGSTRFNHTNKVTVCEERLIVDGEMLFATDEVECLYATAAVITCMACMACTGTAGTP